MYKPHSLVTLSVLPGADGADHQWAMLLFLLAGAAADLMGDSTDLKKSLNIP